MGRLSACGATARPSTCTPSRTRSWSVPTNLHTIPHSLLARVAAVPTNLHTIPHSLLAHFAAVPTAPCLRLPPLTSHRVSACAVARVPVNVRAEVPDNHRHGNSCPNSTARDTNAIAKPPVAVLAGPGHGPNAPRNVCPEDGRQLPLRHARRRRRPVRTSTVPTTVPATPTLRLTIECRTVRLTLRLTVLSNVQSDGSTTAREAKRREDSFEDSFAWHVRTLVLQEACYTVAAPGAPEG